MVVQVASLILTVVAVPLGVMLASVAYRLFKNFLVDEEFADLETVTAVGGQSGGNSVCGIVQCPVCGCLIPDDVDTGLVQPVHGVVPTVAQPLSTDPAGRVIA